MLRAFLVTLLASSLSFAGLPPTFLGGGQSGAANNVTFNFQTPFQQYTQIAGVTGRIETGSENILPNPNFEAATLNWSVFSGAGSVSIETVSPAFEKQSMRITDSGGNTIVATSSIVPIPAGLSSSNGQFFCRFKSTSTTSYTITMSAQDNATNVLNSQTFTIASTASGATNILQGFNFAYNSTMTGILPLITVVTSGGSVIVDDCFIGPALNIGFAVPAGNWTNAGVNTVTGTTTNPTKGATTIDRFLWRQVGSNLEGRIELSWTTAGSAGSGDYLFAIPASTGCTIDSTKVNFNNTVGANGAAPPGNAVGSASGGRASTAAGGGVTSVYDSTHVRMFITSTATAVYQAVGSGFYDMGGANQGFAASFSVPCVGWAPSSTALNPNCNNDGTCVNTFIAELSSAGVISNPNVGAWLSSCAFASGTETCTLGTNFFSVAPVCTATVAGATAGFIKRTSVSTTQVVIDTANTGGTATALAVSLNCVRSGADIRPQVNMPVILGGVSTQFSALNEKRWKFQFYTTAWSTNCNTGNCNTTPALTNAVLTRTAQGAYTFAPNSGVCTVPPICTGDVNDNATAVAMYPASTVPTVTAYLFTVTNGSTARDVYGVLDCSCY